MIKNYFHQIQILVFFVCSFAVFGSFQFLSNRIDEQDVEEYLVSLRSEKLIGCLSFYERQNDILVLGDSHSYTAIDYYKLSQLTGTTKISSCAMGGLYFDSLILLVEKIPTFKFIPKNIIFGLSLRQFTTGSDRESQLKEHGKLIAAMGVSAQNIFLKIKKNLEVLAKKFVSGGSLAIERQSEIDYWLPKLTSLDYTKVEHVFENLDHPSKDNWKKYMQQLKFLDSNESGIQRFCNVIQKHGISLFLVDLPESPLLQKMYMSKDTQTYEKIIQQLSKCAKKTIRLTNEQWGIDGRSFLNRSLDRKFNFDQLHKELNNAPQAQRILAFDLDHPNIIGAQIITEKLYEQMRPELKNAF